jgi:hypothetical protein
MAFAKRRKGLIYQLLGRELAHNIKVSNTLSAGAA